MTRVQRLKVLGAGLLAGLVATLLMALLMAVGRYWLGISPPPEAIPDRIAPTLDVDTFLDALRRFGGYNELKKLGIRGGVTGLFALGALVGVAYAAVAESARARRTAPWRWGLNRPGLLFVAGAFIVLWIVSLAVLWPVLDANYRGLPPSTARWVTALGLLVAYAAYGIALVATYRLITRRPDRRPETESETETEAVPAPAPVPVAEPIGRRAVLAGVAGVALAVPSVALFRRLYDQATFSYDGRRYSGPGIQPITPQDAFYTVTKNVVDPDVSKRFWRLEINGLVENSHTYDFDELAALPTTTQLTTLMCISNAVSAGLISNAEWRGVPLRDLLTAAGVEDDAVEVVLRGADGYADTFAIDKALDPTTLVVYEMNGEPLSRIHGYPVRVIVPGLYGEKNVKWVTGIEVVDHDAKGFYEQQGWGPDFVVPTRSDFFAPQLTAGNRRFRDPFPLNRATELRGRAFAGARGVSRVEVTTDDGQTWQEAELDYKNTDLEWVFWSYDWRPTEPGDYSLAVRAYDGPGALQETEPRPTVRSGQTGLHRATAVVEP